MDLSTDCGLINSWQDEIHLSLVTIILNHGVEGEYCLAKGELWELLLFLISLHHAVGLFCNKLQRMTKCGKNISDTLIPAFCSTFLFLPHFDVICDLLLNRCLTTGNSFVNFSN